MTNSLYTGARGKGLLSKLSKARRAFKLQPKYDGCYATLTTDSEGRVSSVITRSGRVNPRAARDYLGLYFGAPDSILTAELELYTEAANRIAEQRGYRRFYAFDILRLCGDDLSSERYATRHDWLSKVREHVMGETPDRLFADRTGRLHAPLRDHYGRKAGTFAKDIPTAWRRWDVAPLRSLSDHDALWSQWVLSEGLGAPVEGLVAVALDAPVGRRGSKLKIKRADTLDCVVLSASPTRAVVRCLQLRGSQPFTVPCKGLALSKGDMVEVRYYGFYEATFTPKHPGIVRNRPDLQG